MLQLKISRYKQSIHVMLTHSGTLPGSTVILIAKLHSSKNIKMWCTTRHMIPNAGPGACAGHLTSVR